MGNISEDAQDKISKLLLSGRYRVSTPAIERGEGGGILSTRHLYSERRFSALTQLIGRNTNIFIYENIYTCTQERLGSLQSRTKSESLNLKLDSRIIPEDPGHPVSRSVFSAEIILFRDVVWMASTPRYSNLKSNVCRDEHGTRRISSIGNYRPRRSYQISSVLAGNSVYWPIGLIHGTMLTAMDI